MTTNNHQPTEEEKKQIYEFYKSIFSSSFKKQKKNKFDKFIISLGTMELESCWYHH